jgi:methylated-DNA-protein-cysteine methyltransferase-like protein
VDLTPEQRALLPLIDEVVKQVPPGQVTTYGDVARIVGAGCDARLVGQAMAMVDDAAVPWQRVINAKGMISPRPGRGAELQRQRLEAEGVSFDARGRIDLSRFAWRGPSPDWAAAHGCQTLEDGGEPSQPALF